MTHVGEPTLGGVAKKLASSEDDKVIDCVRLSTGGQARREERPWRNA
jgi:hypothetical protein